MSAKIDDLVVTGNFNEILSQYHVYRDLLLKNNSDLQRLFEGTYQFCGYGSYMTSINPHPKLPKQTKCSFPMWKKDNVIIASYYPESYSNGLFMPNIYLEGCCIFECKDIVKKKWKYYSSILSSSMLPGLRTIKINLFSRDHIKAKLFWIISNLQNNLFVNQYLFCYLLHYILNITNN